MLHVLGASLLLLIVGWIVLTALGKSVPDGIPVVIGAIVGALTGVIAVNAKADGQ